MPKKPFSNKQKKKQLQQKRVKKKSGGPKVRDSHKDSSGDEGHSYSSSEADDNQNETGNNLPSDRKNWKKTKPKRYELLFNEEQQQEIEERKQKSREALQYVKQEELEISFSEDTGKDFSIDIPKRPKWNYNMTKEEVEKQEARMFAAYLHDLSTKHKTENLSYFEHNLETWRQLWRVLEVSDIVLIIADTRHPIIHFPISLWKHVVQDLKKQVIIVLNKIDLVPPELVVAWKHYFTQTFPDLRVITFTSFPKDPEIVAPKPGKVLQKRRRKKGGYVAVGQRDLLNACQELCPNEDLHEWENLISCQEVRKVHQTEAYGYDSDDNEDSTQAVDNSSIAEDEHILTLGLVGHPNVGKSTFLNGLYGRKVVSTSRTPGHTKYFQTIFLTRNVRLCDCPGLVFPAVIDKQLQILSGMYPIAQVREPYTSVGYLASRIPLVQLLKLIHPSMSDDNDIDAADVTWSAWDICAAWAYKRGYLTAKAGRPDVYRAANSLLRLAVDGRLCLCFYPPDFVKQEDEWKRNPEIAIITKLQKNFTGVKTSTETWSDDTSDKKSESTSEEDDAVTDRVSASFNKFAALAADDS